MSEDQAGYIITTGNSPDDIPEATFEDILSEYETEEGEFTYIVGEGSQAKRYTAKRLTNLSDTLAFSEAAKTFREQYEKVRRKDMKDLPEILRPWKQYAAHPMSMKAAVIIIYLTRLLICPKLSQLQCLRLFHKGGRALLDIGEPLFETSNENAYENEVSDVTDAKND